MKKLPFDDLSDITCSHRDRTGRNDCTTKIKQNVVNRVQNTSRRMCYKHYCAVNNINPRARKENSHNWNTRLHRALDKQGIHLK